jgi:hypothetical protein
MNPFTRLISTVANYNPPKLFDRYRSRSNRSSVIESTEPDVFLLTHFPPEIILEIFARMDPITRLSMPKVCHYFWHICRLYNPTQMCISVGVTPESIMSDHLIEPFHQIFCEKPYSRQLYRRKRRLPDPEHILYTYRSDRFLRFLTPLQYQPFENLQTLVLYINYRHMKVHNMYVDWFRTVRTLEIHMVNRRCTRMPLKRRSKEKLHRLRRLVLYGHYMEKLLSTCPGVLTLKCDAHLWARLKTDKKELKHYQNDKRTHPLRRLHIWHHEEVQDAPMEPLNNGWLKVFRELTKVTFRVDSLTRYNHSFLPLFPQVRRVSYKLMLCHDEWQDVDETLLKPLVERLAQYTDLDAAKVTVNTLRLTPFTTYDEVRDFVRWVLISNQNHRGWEFKAEKADRLRARYTCLLEPNRWRNWDPLCMFWFGTWTSLKIWAQLDQSLLNQLPRRSRHLCELELAYREQHMESLDFAFLVKLRSLNKLVMENTIPTDTEQLEIAIKRHRPFSHLEFHEPISHRLIRNLIHFFQLKAIREPDMLFKLAFMASDCPKTLEETATAPNFHVYGLNRRRSKYTLMNHPDPDGPRRFI